MNKIRTIARIYDRKTGEYIQRIVECPISDELAKALAKEINGPDHKEIRGKGHGDDDSILVLSTPLRNQERFHADPVLEIISIDDNGNEATIGGWRFM